MPALDDSNRLSLLAVALPKPQAMARGHAQLSLVEHALCPLDATACLAGPLTHETEYDYRALDPASRRLYLLLKKIFWRQELSPDFDLHDLAVNVLGFTAKHETWKLKQKVTRCIETLLDADIIRLPIGVAQPQDLFIKRAKGHYSIRFHRGSHFDQPTTSAPMQVVDSPLYDPLHSIGFDDPATCHDISLIATRYTVPALQTIAAAQYR